MSGPGHTCPAAGGPALMRQAAPTTMVIHARNSGFFSNFNCVISNLEARLGRDGCTAAAVEWSAPAGGSHFVYGSAQDGNLWLHFFEQLRFENRPAQQFDVGDFPSANATLITGIDAYATYKLNPFWRRRFHQLFSRYITVQPHLAARIEAIFHARMAGKFCVGVHYRDPRHAHECPNPMPPPEVFVQRVRALLKAQSNPAIFLATDFEPAVAAFQAAFGNSLVLQPSVCRADAQSPDQMHHMTEDPSLLLGEQVLIDCLLLARCHVLLHVNSNIATAALYMNPRMRGVYCETLAEACLGYLWSVLRMLELWLRTGRGRALFPLAKYLYRLAIRRPH